MPGFRSEGRRSTPRRPTLRRPARLRPTSRLPALLPIALIALWGCREQAAPPTSPVSQAPAFIGRAKCLECHGDQVRLWSGSDHDRAMMIADSTTVLGDFGDAVLVHAGDTSRFFREGGIYQVRTEGPGGKPGDFAIKYTFGVRPLQQYLVEFPGGRLQALPLAWDTRENRWFHLHPEGKLAPDDWLHWTRGAQTWNGMCADCHSTNLQRGYHAPSDTFHTAFSEINVSCEACHGPGSGHAASPAAVKPLAGRKGADSRTEVMACARCHARRSPLRDGFAHHRDFLDEYAPELLSDSIYHADGQILEENFEYASFLQSRMYHRGVRCTDCHDPHSLKPRAEGNALCLRCHEPARFETGAHHRHQAGGAGSRCIDCHMPARHFMVVDLRRDHSFRIPRPDQSVRFGTPNACNDCHADRKPAWAAAWIVKWHGPKRKPHFSEDLAAGRSGGPGADSALARLGRDTSQPAIARASALSVLGRYMHGLARTALAAGARDADPLVRRASAMGLEAFPEADRLEILLPLLSDSILGVRTAAAHALASASPAMPPAMRPAFDSALAAYRASLEANAYFPSGRFNLGLLHDRQGRRDSAILAYSQALEMDNRFIPARMNLAQDLHAAGRIPEAVGQFREALRFRPGYGDAHYSLGLLWAEQARMDSAAFHLERAAADLPRHPRVHYNLALALQNLGRVEDADRAFAKAQEVQGETGELLYARAVLHAQKGNWKKAEGFIRRLRAVEPNHQGLPALMQALGSR